MRKFIWAMPLAIAVALGCSHTTRDRLVHWFFEVPDESKVQEAAEPTTAPTHEPPTLKVAESKYKSTHKPVVARSCARCHDTSGNMRVSQEKMMGSCRVCHERFFSDEVTHDPVLEQQCTDCHSLHRSERLHLLKQPVLDLCVECHDEPDELSEEAHGGEGVEKCDSCHDAHFGEEALLKPGYTGPGAGE